MVTAFNDICIYTIKCSSVMDSDIQLLDTENTKVLYLDSGDFCTSHFQSLNIDANELSLTNQRIKLSLQCVFKLKTNQLWPPYEDVFEFTADAIYKTRPRFLLPLRLHIKYD